MPPAMMHHNTYGLSVDAPFSVLRTGDRCWQCSSATWYPVEQGHYPGDYWQYTVCQCEGCDGHRIVYEEASHA